MASLYDGQCHPFSLSEGWHAPAGRRTCEPRPLPRPGRSDRQRGWVPGTLDPGRQIVSQDPNGVSRIGGQAGTQRPLTRRPHRRETGEAGPEAQSTDSLPNRRAQRVGVAGTLAGSDPPVRCAAPAAPPGHMTACAEVMPSTSFGASRCESIRHCPAWEAVRSGLLYGPKCGSGCAQMTERERWSGLVPPLI
jgi:hypothetical protein